MGRHLGDSQLVYIIIHYIYIYASSLDYHIWKTTATHTCNCSIRFEASGIHHKLNYFVTNHLLKNLVKFYWKMKWFRRSFTVFCANENLLYVICKKFFKNWWPHRRTTISVIIKLVSLLSMFQPYTYMLHLWRTGNCSLLHPIY